MTSWPAVTVRDVALVVTKGTTPTTGGGKFSTSGVTFIKVESITKNGVVDRSRVAFIDEQTHRLLKRSTLMADDILFTIAGTIGRVARVDQSLLPANTNQAVAVIRPNLDVVHGRFLYYALRDTRRVGEALSRIVQSVQANLSLSELSEILLPLPPIKDQRSIADILGALDDKITVNVRLAAITNELLGALFTRISASAPVGRLADIAQINAATTKPTPGGQLRYLDISAVSVGTYTEPALTSWDEAPGRARRVVQAGDTVWSTVRPNRRSHALVLDDSGDFVASTGLAVISPSDGRIAGVHESTRTDVFVQYLESVAEGSAYPAVRGDRFNDAPVPDLAPHEWDEFEAVALPMRQRLAAAEHENRVLVATRDELLPLLMSGEIRVPDAENVVAEVV